MLYLYNKYISTVY